MEMIAAGVLVALGVAWYARRRNQEAERKREGRRPPDTSEWFV